MVVKGKEKKGPAMLHLTEAEARRLGIGATKKKPRKKSQKIIVQSKSNWLAKPIKGGLLLVIPYNLPSLNEWKNWSGFKQHDYKQMLTQAITYVCMKFRIREFTAANKKAQVEVAHYHRVRRTRDDDNYTPKFLNDSLKAAGLIYDDNHKVLDLPKPAFCVDEECFRTEVRIYYQIKNEARNDKNH